MFLPMSRTLFLYSQAFYSFSFRFFSCAAKHTRRLLFFLTQNSNSFPFSPRLHYSHTLFSPPEPSFHFLSIFFACASLFNICSQTLSKRALAMVIQRVYGHDSDFSIRHGGIRGGRKLRGRRVGNYIVGDFAQAFAPEAAAP
jgi:hypothetical protein